jgi:alpha-tubulin suppressor-like RCC1 family protein
MAFTKITSTNIAANTVASYAEFSNFAASLAPRVSYANVANSLYFTVDDTAVNVGGGYIVVTGANFQSGATVLIDTVQASAVTYVDSTTLRVQVPARSAATYSLYVVNPDGGTGIRVNGLTYSSEPSWVTSSPLGNQVANTAFNVTLSANGATSYAVAAGSTLPAGTSLLANGYFSGTVTVGAETTYSFSVVATDAELQDSSKTFQVTVTVIPPYYLWTWGQNSSGQLGLNDRVFRSSPVQIGADSWALTVSTSSYSTAAIKSNGTLWTWGSNAYGQLGSNNIVDRSSPTQVGALTNWSQIVNASYTQIALKNDGTLWTWGYNAAGRLGLNDTVYRSSPTQVGTATNWSKVCGSNMSPSAIKTNGTLWTWGLGPYGGAGHNDIVARSSPTQLGTDTNWSNAFTTFYSAHAIKTDGTLWGWGFNEDGNLGNNTAINRSSPVQIGSSTDWSTVAAHNQTRLAIKTNGTLWGWGRNFAGNLGLNDRVTRSSPTQVGADTNWSGIAIGGRVSAAVKTNGTLWTWSDGGAGIVSGATGQNDLTYRSSPTQVGTGTTWLKVSIGYTATAIRTN